MKKYSMWLALLKGIQYVLNKDQEDEPTETFDEENGSDNELYVDEQTERQIEHYDTKPTKSFKRSSKWDEVRNIRISFDGDEILVNYDESPNPLAYHAVAIAHSYLPYTEITGGEVSN